MFIILYNVHQVSTWFANARRRLKKENKMQWSPRNRTGDDDDDDKSCSDEDDDGDRKDEELAKSRAGCTVGCGDRAACREDKGGSDCKGDKKEMTVGKISLINQKFVPMERIHREYPCRKYIGNSDVGNTQGILM